jgi:hypothetical protein
VASGADCCDITQPSDRTTSTLGAGPGSDLTTPLDCPPGGEITTSRGLDRLVTLGTTALRASLPAPLVGIAGSWRLRSRHCHFLLLLRPRGPVVACNGSLATTMLIAARGALSERRPVTS